MKGGAPGETEVLAQRIEFVDRLAERPLHKADLVEEFDHSRSTVNRAIKELEEAGFVERATEGYVATQAGRLASESYLAFAEEQSAILGAQNVLSEVPHEWALPMDLVTDGQVVSTDPGYRLFESFADRARTADRCHVAVPTLLDSRHLRVCHARACEGELAVTFHATESVLADVASEFPYLWSELESAESFVPRSGERPPLGLVVWSDGGDPTAATLVTADRGEITGFVDSTNPEGVRWVRERFDALDVDSPDASGDLRSTGSVSDLPPLTGSRLPSRLRSEGFVRVDDRYFERREPLDPKIAWRAGVDVPEVAAGYAVERTVKQWDGDETRTLTDDLAGRLREGQDTALLGLPGAGKSTVCKSVACEWHDEGIGPVFYRESGAGQAFESPAALEAAVGEAEGTALVVVEDAVRPEANDVFEVMQAFEADDSTVFLLDAREAEWRDPEEFPVDARLRAFRHESVETVTVPRLVERDCERLVDRVESVTGDRLDVDAGDLLSDLRPLADGEPGAGIMPLLFHRLTQYLDPLGGGETETTLDEDVDRVREDLASVGETALDAGVLVNVLNAAGLGVHPEFVHAVAADEERRHRDVREAIDRLEGEVLFPSSADDDGPYREAHEVWSARFLKRLLDDEGEAAAQRRFGRVVTAFLALADSIDRREAVRAGAGGEKRALSAVVTAPSDWAAEAVSAVFAVGRRYPKLAGLFGTTGQSDLRLPEACPDPTAARCTEWRGWMYVRAGALDRAGDEFRRLESADASLAGEEADRARLNGLLGRAVTARRRGDLEASAELAREARDLASDLGDRSLEAEALRSLGIVTEMRGDFESAEGHHERSLDLVEEIDDRHGRANALNNLGVIALRRGDLASAGEYLRESLDIVQEVGDRNDAADRFINLGLHARKDGDFETAEGYFQQALEIKREIGDRSSQAICLANLGKVARLRGDFEAAREYFQETLTIERAVDDRQGASLTLGMLGVIGLRLGEFEVARQRLEESVRGFRETGDDCRLAQGYNRLGRLALAEGDRERARERFEEAREVFDDVGDTGGRARVLGNLGYLAYVRGDFETARQRLQESLEVEREVADPREVAQTLERLGMASFRLNDPGNARECLRESVDIGREIGNRYRSALSEGLLGAVLLSTGDTDAGREKRESAVSTLAGLGARPDELRVLKHHLEAEWELGNRERATDLCERIEERSEAVEVSHADSVESIRRGAASGDESEDERASL